MKNFLILILCSAFTCACSTTDHSRSPSSIAGSRTALGKGARITLRQPVPFINTESSKQTVKVIGRRSFSYAGVEYLCALSAQVPKQETFFFEEGTVFDFKDQAGAGSNSTFLPKKGSPVNLSCFNAATGEKKSSITLEEAQSAFPQDVLVIEQTLKFEIESEKKNDSKNELVRH